MFSDDRFCIGDVNLNFMLWVFIMLHYEHRISTKILVVGNRLINVCRIYVGYTYDQCVVGRPYTLAR